MICVALLPAIPGGSGADINNDKRFTTTYGIVCALRINADCDTKQFEGATNSRAVKMHQTSVHDNDRFSTQPTRPSELSE